MSVFPLVYEFQGLTLPEFSELQSLPWQKSGAQFPEDSVFVVLKGKLKLGKRIYRPRQLGGVLPFCENTRATVEKNFPAEVLYLPTKELARFFLRNPAAHRSFLAALFWQKRTILPRYQKEPVVITIWDGTTNAKISQWQNFFQNADFFLMEKLNFAQFFYEKRLEKDVLVIYQAGDDFLLRQAQMHIIIEKTKDKLIQKIKENFWPGIVFAFTEKSFLEKREKFSEKINNLIFYLKQRQNIYFWNEISLQQELFFSKIKNLIETPSLHVLHGLTSLYWSLENFGILKKLSFYKLLQPIYPHQVYYKLNYTLKKLSRLLPKNQDLVDLPFVFSGPLWFASGELPLVLVFSAFPNKMFINYPPMSLLSPISRMLRLGLFTTYFETGLLPNLNPQLASQPLSADFLYGFLNPNYELLY